MKEHFIIYEYLKVLVTRSLKLLLAGNGVQDDHNLLLYNNCRFSLPGGQGQGVEVEQGFSGRKPLTHRHRHHHPLLPSPSLVVKRRRSDNVEFKCGECGG